MPGTTCLIMSGVINVNFGSSFRTSRMAVGLIFNKAVTSA